MYSVADVDVVLCFENCFDGSSSVFIAVGSHVIGVHCPCTDGTRADCRLSNLTTGSPLLENNRCMSLPTSSSVMFFALICRVFPFPYSARIDGFELRTG